MNDRSDRGSPEEPDWVQERKRQLALVWNELDNSRDSGATTLEVVESHRLQVTDCLAGDPPDIGRADSITAHVLLLISGGGGGEL